MVIDGRITRENFERFMAAHSPPEGWCRLVHCSWNA